MNVMVVLGMLVPQASWAERKVRPLFSEEELLKLEKLKSDDALSLNFENYIKNQTEKKLGILTKNASKAHLKFLKAQVKSEPWKQLDKTDQDLMMKKLIKNIESEGRKP